jgi:transcriptional regulator with XRE-family HTH domain
VRAPCSGAWAEAERSDGIERRGSTRRLHKLSIENRGRFADRAHEVPESGPAKFTQAELAEKVGVAVETISRLERGSAMPSLARMEEIASALGVELPDLFDFKDRETARDKAIERLLAVVRRRPAEDIELVRDIAGRIFARWR